MNEHASAAASKESLGARLAGLDVHPLREQIYNELHSRPYQVLECPAQITHLALQHGGAEREREHALLVNLCERHQIPAPTFSMPCFQQDFGLFELRWERHNEFSSYTFIRKGPRQGAPFVRNGIDYVPQEWVQQLPGTVVAAFHLLVEPGGEGLEADRDTLSGWFEHLRLVGSEPVAGKAAVWTTFRLHSDGFGRFLVWNRALTPTQLGRLCQRLIELETYRLMASLGLPLARELSPRLNELEQSLKAVTEEVASPGGAKEDRALMLKLSRMAAQVEAWRSRSSYRFAATAAYHGIVQQRLEMLRDREREIAGHLTINEFLVRRLTPAVRTCTDLDRRLEDLSTRVDQASRLLRTRIQLAVEEQNQNLLAAMNRRSRIQLRLQQTVEGLSVAAISYYLVSLLKLGFEALYELGVPLDKSLATGLSIPLVAGTVWWATRRIHHHFNRLERDSAPGQES